MDTASYHTIRSTRISTVDKPKGTYTRPFHSALLHGVEFAFQAVSYGLTSTAMFGDVGAICKNFGIRGVSITPALMVVRHFGARKEVIAEESGVSSGLLPSETDSSSEKQAGVRHLDYVKSRRRGGGGMCRLEHGMCERRATVGL